MTGISTVVIYNGLTMSAVQSVVVGLTTILTTMSVTLDVVSCVIFIALSQLIYGHC